MQALMYLDDVGRNYCPFAMLLRYNDSALVYDRTDGRRRKTRYSNGVVQVQQLDGHSIWDGLTMPRIEDPMLHVGTYNELVPL